MIRPSGGEKCGLGAIAATRRLGAGHGIRSALPPAVTVEHSLVADAGAVVLDLAPGVLVTVEKARDKIRESGVELALVLGVSRLQLGEQSGLRCGRNIRIPFPRVFSRRSRPMPTLFRTGGIHQLSMPPFMGPDRSLGWPPFAQPSQERGFWRRTCSTWSGRRAYPLLYCT